jgi:hypothetical protein
VKHLTRSLNGDPVRFLTRVQSAEPVKYCPTCLKSNVHTKVEYYRITQLNFCTYHYWLMKGRDAGGATYSLDRYIKASELHAFKTSLPLPDEMAMMGGD